MFIFFTSFVLQPTTAKGNSKILIHNIFFNSFEFTTLSGNITDSISDTFIKFGILKDFVNPKPYPKSNVYTKNFDNFHSNKSKQALHKINWINEILKNGNDINEIFYMFYKTLSEMVHHAMYHFMRHQKRKSFTVEIIDK